MNTEQLICVINRVPRLKDIVQGIYTRDTLPSTVTKYPSAYIVNTDVSTGEGIHWVLFYFETASYAEFYDSFGKSPKMYYSQFEKFIYNNVSNVKYNTMKMQSPYSQVCGYYVIYFLIMKLLKYTMSDIQSYFTSDKQLNDDHVYGFVIHQFSSCIV